MTGWKERQTQTQLKRARILISSRAGKAAGQAPVRDKYRRAHGGCLGSRRRRRARQAAKSRGEARTACDPRMPEWGNPSRWRRDNLFKVANPLN